LAVEVVLIVLLEEAVVLVQGEDLVLLGVLAQLDKEIMVVLVQEQEAMEKAVVEEVQVQLEVTT
jgi:hypothetical protein